jgi:F-type H+-transporting ATPase subunit b
MNEILTSNLAQFIWGLSAFVVFVLILFKVGVKHILAAVDAREARIRKDLSDAEQASVEAKRQREANEVERKAHEAKIAELMAEVRRDAEEHKSKLVEQGRQEIEAMRVRALREIEAARHAAVVDLRNVVSEVAVLVAEKAIGERLDVAKHEDLIRVAVERFDTQNA